jgi:hypothetical protein
MFGEMEQNSHSPDISRYGKKSGKPVCEKLLSLKTDIKRIANRKLHILPFFLPYFTQFYHFLYFAALWSPRDHVVTSKQRA